MRIGLLGGTFNPIHNGHLFFAEQAKRELDLDKIILIPACMPVHKEPEFLADSEDRLRMMEIAIKSKPGFEISRYEVDKKQKCYSIEILTNLSNLYPRDTEFFFLIGSDMLYGLGRWNEIDRLLQLCQFIVCERPGSTADINHDNIERINIESVDISSTEIRRKIKNRENVSGLLPDNVETYIISKNLYK